MRSRFVLTPGFCLNGLAVIAFLISLYCCTNPGLQSIPGNFNGTSNILLQITLFLLFIHFGLMSWMSIWVIVIWGWIIWFISSFNKLNQKTNRVKFLMAPVLLGLLYTFWITQIPLKINFALHKPTLEQLANQLEEEPEKLIELEQGISNFKVIAGYQLDPTKISLIIEGIGAYQGFIRDNSRQPNQLKAIEYSFAPGSNNGDQSMYYLGDGWYVFQNYFD
jgi:hypothetical protein